MPRTLPLTIIFDVDGTLYEEPAAYARYVEELSRYVAPERQEEFLAEWHAAREGRHALRVGGGYDVPTDTLFRHLAGTIISHCDWQGHPLPAMPNPEASPPSEDARPGALPTETLVFGDDVLSIGDLWGLASALAIHYGLARSERDNAFLATRAYMDGPDFPMSPSPGLAQILERLHRSTVRLVAMTNSPAETTQTVLGKLGLLSYFDETFAAARKPRGIREVLAGHPAPARILSIGDNYINEIEPVLQAGGAALYIDRCTTGFGAGQSRCAIVESIPGLVNWLDEHLTGLT